MSGFNKRPRKTRGTGSGRTGSSRGTNPTLSGTIRGGSSGSGFTRGSNSGSSSRSNTTVGDSRVSTSDLIPLIGQNRMDSTYADMLNRNAGDDQFAQLLASLGITQEQGLNGSQRDDYNKQLLDMILKHYADLEQRGYNEQVLSEQRLYDNPINQLARLMGAGISRDAAIQMLSGSGSGSGSGSPLIGGSAAEVPQGLPASQSNLNGIQAGTAVASTIFGAIGSLASGIGSLGQFGISAATLSTNIAATQAATAGQLLGNKQLAQTLAGIDAASTIIGTLSTAMDAGFMASDMSFGSSQDMLKYISDNADKYEPFKAMVETGALRKASQDLYTLNALNSGYKAWRESRDYGIDRDYIYKSQVLDLLARDVNIDLASSEVELNHQNVDESINRMLNDNLRVENETQLAQAQLGLLGEQQESLRINNVVNRLDAEWYQANIDDINTSRLMQVSIEAQGWRRIKDNPELLRKEVDAWLSDRDNARTAIALESIYLDDQYNTALEIRSEHNGDGHPLRKLALWWHNMFTYSLGSPKAGEEEAQQLGKFAKSAAALLLFRKGL